MQNNRPSTANDASKNKKKNITIKDIARLAGVSIATVSKVINHKDKDISEDTKQKILSVIEEYNYVPYQKVISRMNAKSGTIGLVIPDVSAAFFRRFVNGVEDCAYKENRSVIICNSYADEDKEQKYLETLREKNVEGIIIVPTSAFEEPETEEADESYFPLVVVSPKTYSGLIGQIHFDHWKEAYLAAEFLIRQKHEQIGYIAGSKGAFDSPDKLEGIKKALYDHNIAFDKNFVFENVYDDDKQCGYDGAKNLISKGVTAIIAGNETVASGCYAAIQEAMLKIPDDISVIGLGDSEICDSLTPSLTSVAYPAYEMGFKACEMLIRLIQQKNGEIKQMFEPAVMDRNSVSAPKAVDRIPKEKIVIVGSLNMDIIMKVPRIPRIGETILAKDIKYAAGGKGANQAVGAGKLGGKVYMIGRVGNDLYGRELYTSLIKNGVDAAGVVFDDLLPTGNAYIYVADNGDNNIVVNPGANSRLSVEQVKSFESIFDQVTYCLVQMEIPLDTVEYVATLCREKNVRLILNPAPARELNYEYFHGCFLVVPNETEIDLMVPGNFTVEEKAVRLLGKGFQNVIVTLGEKGSLLVTPTIRRHFPAAAFKAVDTTGAGDSFISGLAVALAEGQNLEQAIRFASVAAGITISREGAQPSLPDRETIRMYL